MSTAETEAPSPGTGSTFDLIVPEEVPPGTRLDRFLAENARLRRRARLKHELDGIYRNGKPAKLSTGVAPGDRVQGRLVPPPRQDTPPQNIPLDIVYEARSFLVINKPQGLVVHPGAGNPEGTLVNALLWRYPREDYFSLPRDGSRCGPDADGDAPVRPGIVHRLDKDTSGVMIVAKNSDTHHHLVEQFSRGHVLKRYLALTRGRMRRDQGVVDAPIGRDPHHRKRFAVNTVSGKAARTEWRVWRRFSGYTLVMLRPVTGRTHQLRVHMASLGTPILGDPVYARRDHAYPEATLMLHALSLEIIPEPNGTKQCFRTALPERFRTILDASGD